MARRNSRNLHDRTVRLRSIDFRRPDALTSANTVCFKFRGSNIVMSQQYIFVMEGVTRLYEEKEVLSNIWLSFYPGAKIGVLGNNGSGKSTLLRIMAGEERNFMGHVQPARGIKITYFYEEARIVTILH